MTLKANNIPADNQQVHRKHQKPIRTGKEYIDSLRGRKLKIYLHGELIEEPVDHPIIQPSINALAETYDVANNEPDLALVRSSITGKKINRFLHIVENANDLVLQNKMQRKLGQLTGTCFQRCVGMDAINALHSVTYDIDEKHETGYHQRFLEFIKLVQETNVVIGGAMTDPKGDRSKAPHEQEDPDLFLHVVDKNEAGVYISGAKIHQTGVINSHWMLVMPGLRLTDKDKDYAIVGAIPVEAEGITYIYGRQANDTRSLEGGDIDAGNAKFSGQEAMVIFDKVFIPWEHVFMHGEVEFSSILVERFTTYHRRSYVCKTGLGDVIIGAAATIADYNGVARASHIKDKLVEMTHLNESIYGIGIASSTQARPLKSGVWLNDEMLANVCKQNVTRFPYEISRFAQDLAGGLMVTMPSEKDLNNPATGPILQKYLKGRQGVEVEDRMRILRLIENMTLGRNAVGYLTESMHGAGSPRSQVIQIGRQMQIGYKMNLAKVLSGVKEDLKEPHEPDEYFKRVFNLELPVKDD